ncbi:copper-(or silver)-translocating P-type ATPase [Sporobacter termitidis DSM 10068]|uniref:Cd(2+)-exporting ATPase n=1 Tax=Sporobacter termitidis DSM 10068 TaxID=1123282 RepID=A0A1M5WMZ7_9FIRM|nr:cation-translocating P-type ATPase [Sporobacter termitidis]SHH88494.1 copper-(or silver)-translocating P-type ATPase [Sporobacter termitidis DSM 10068]
MIKRISNLLGGVPMTIAAAVFLAASLILMLAGKALPVDPAWVTVLICGLPLLYLAVTRLIFQRWVSSALLISIAMIASIAIGELFAAGEVAFIMAIGAILEDKTVERSKKGLKRLISLTPAQGRGLTTDAAGSREEMIPAEHIKAGDHLRILPGETIPADGEIISGTTSIDQAIMTGESLPVDKAPGDNVFCGTINCFGAIDITVTTAGADSSLQRLIRLVQEAENSKAPMQRIADKWATWLVPIALAIAVITFLVTGEIIRAVTILVVFCPCALALATPTSIMAAIGQATRHGVMIKSGEALEIMGKADCIAFDKTGTLTHGALTVSDIYPLAEGVNGVALLRLAASAEAYSEHPLAKAIVAYAKENHVATDAASDFQMLPGKGIRAIVDGRELLCGSAAYLRENAVHIDDRARTELERFRAQGKAVVLVALEQALVGAIALSDTIRDTAKSMVQELRDMDTQVVLLTGDHRQTADYFAERVGISSVRAELLPADKVRSIEELKKQGHKVCMIGDGVNDAPALKAADVGVAMGGMGSDIAVEAADIALIGDDIAKIPYLKKLSNATVRTIKFNIMLSMAINFAAIALSVAGILNPVSGALVHNAGSVLVVLNAALLYDRKYK